MNTKTIKEYKKRLKLTKRQRDILVGLLLGDGHLESQNNGITYRLKVEHSIKQVDYVEWLYSEFKGWVNSGVYKRSRKDGYVRCGFTTYSHEAFRFYGHQFYQGKKVIPKILYKLLTPIGMAIWFMDDGSRKSLRHKTYIIHTLGYTRKELEKVQGVLVKKFNLHTKLHKQKRNYLRIYILSRSARELERIVKKYVDRIPSMKHKLGNINA